MASSISRLAPLPKVPSRPAVPLPRVPGPKLAPFTPNARADIEFVEFLGRANDVDSQVWKVKINGALFSLKAFYFCHSETLRQNQGGDLTRPLANSQLYIDYFDPFNCECRAYGRLKKRQRENLAVKAYGYLLLTPQQETELARKVTGNPSLLSHASAGTLDGDNFWKRYEEHRGQPVRAIVKELVSGKAPNPHDAQRMWADLDNLHSLGIFVRDTHGGNYLGGKLVDFSRSWTMYHPALVHIGENTLQLLMLEELQQLLDYYYELANSLSDEIDVPEDLESYCSGQIAKYKNLPRAYNWLKWDKNAAAVKAHVESELYQEPAL